MSRNLTTAAFGEAKALDHGWVGPEHFLLAVLAAPSVATDVLNGLGVDHERVAGFLRTREHRPNGPPPRYDPDKGLTGPNPAGHKLTGRAEGLAVAWGRGTPSAEDWLVAMVYDSGSIASLLHALSTTQEAVLAQLRAGRVQVPDVDPPWYRPWRGRGEAEVSPDELGPLLRLLKERHPPGSEWRWGFNWIVGEPRRAIVIAEEGIDLTGLVDESRGATPSE